MICEFRNSLERYICFFIGADPKNHITKETHLSDVIFTIFITLLIIIIVAWWIVPLRILRKSINLNPKFVCDKYKEE